MFVSLSMGSHYCCCWWILDRITPASPAIDTAPAGRVGSDAPPEVGGDDISPADSGESVIIWKCDSIGCACGTGCGTAIAIGCCCGGGGNWCGCGTVGSGLAVVP